MNLFRVLVPGCSVLITPPDGSPELSSKDVHVQVESGAVPSSVPPGARFCGPESEAEESGAARVRLSDLMRRAHP